MNAHHVIAMLVFATCVWTTVNCSEVECVICDHCEQKNTSSYDKRKCPEVEVGLNVCVTESYESGRVLRRCLRPGEGHDALCRESIDPATSEKVHICSCEPGFCDVGRWGSDPWHTTEWTHFNDDNDAAWFNDYSKIIFILIGIVFVFAIGCIAYHELKSCFEKCCKSTNARGSRRRRLSDDEFPTVDGSTGYMVYPNAHIAPAYPPSAPGNPPSAPGNQPSAPGNPPSAPGDSTSAPENPPRHPWFGAAT